MTMRGIDPGQAMQLMPLLRQEAVRQQASEDRGNIGESGLASTTSQASQDRGVLNIDQPKMSGSAQRGESMDSDEFATKMSDKYGVNADFSTITTPEGVTAAQKLAPSMSRSQIRSRGEELSIANPLRYPSVEEGMGEAERELSADRDVYNQRLGLREREVGLQSAFSNSFEKSLSRKLQKEGTQIYQDIPGEYMDRMESEGFKMVSDGVSPEKAAKVLSEKGLNFAKARANTKELGTRAAAGRGANELLRDLKNSRRFYSDMGAQELFVEDMKQHNELGDHLASAIAYDVTPAIASTMKNFKSEMVPAGDTVTEMDVIEATNKVNENSRKAADGIIGKISDNDSLFTIAFHANENGLDENIIMDEIQRAYDDESLQLNERQLRELQNRSPVTFTMGDMFISAFTGMFGKKEKKPWAEKIRRALGKR